MTNRPTPFGLPAIAAVPLCTTRSEAQCAAPFDVLRAVRGAGGAGGTVLLESGASPGQPLPTTRRSVVVARALLRVEIRAAEVRYVPLSTDAEPLLDALASGLVATSREGADLVAMLPDSRPELGMLDRDVLRLPSALDGLRRVAGLLADRGGDAWLPPGLFGAFGYEMVDRFEDLPPRRPDPLHEPDASFVLASDMVVFDHTTGRVQAITRGLPGDRARMVQSRHDDLVAMLGGPRGEPEPLVHESTPAPAVPDVTDEEFCEAVATLREHIGAGDVFQAVLSRGLTMESDAASVDVYRALSAANPSPYMFHMDLPDGALLGASPETFLRVEDGEVEIRPIAGTAPRGIDGDAGIDRDLDDRLALGLLLDPKEQAEHAMLLDLARNDVARMSEPGTTRVVQQLAIEKYSHVQHLVSRVRGALRSDLDALHAYRAAANMGTLTGAPKVRAMELIRTLEPVARGFYGGAMGYLLQDGSMDTCIVIRSLRQKGRHYHTRAGAGVVWASDPEAELLETEHKARAVAAAVARAGRSPEVSS